MYEEKNRIASPRQSGQHEQEEQRRGELARMASRKLRASNTPNEEARKYPSNNKADKGSCQVSETVTGVSRST
jgi:hypothetical protein